MAERSWTTGVIGRFEPGSSSVREARRFVASVLEDVGDERADDAALLTSELATNAVIHAQSAYTVAVRRAEDGRVRVEVADASAAVARRCRYSATSGTGRGLGMVEDLAAAWGIDDGAPGGKVVWFELDVDRPAAGGADRSAAVVADEGEPPPDLDAMLSELGGWDDEDDDAPPAATTAWRWAA